jgi:hypothetical protein
MRFLDRFDWEAYQQARSEIGEGQRRMEQAAEQSGVADAVREKRFKPTEA